MGEDPTIIGHNGRWIATAQRFAEEIGPFVKDCSWLKSKDFTEPAAILEHAGMWQHVVASLKCKYVDKATLLLAVAEILKTGNPRWQHH